MAFSLFRESVECRKAKIKRSQPAAAPDNKKALPSGQRFYQSFVFLSFHHIPQRFQFCLAE
jgi:hypothetical protein